MAIHPVVVDIYLSLGQCVANKNKYITNVKMRQNEAEVNLKKKNQKLKVSIISAQLQYILE